MAPDSSSWNSVRMAFQGVGLRILTWHYSPTGLESSPHIHFRSMRQFYWLEDFWIKVISPGFGRSTFMCLRIHSVAPGALD